MTDAPEECPLCNRDHHFLRALAHDTSLAGEVMDRIADRIEETIAAWDRRRNPWQPIETAPKDGTPIYGIWLDGKWTGGQMRWNDMWEDAWVHDTGDHICHPTHWMPLPEPPEDV